MEYEKKKGDTRVREREKKLSTTTATKNGGIWKERKNIQFKKI